MSRSRKVNAGNSKEDNQEPTYDEDPSDRLTKLPLVPQQVQRLSDAKGAYTLVGVALMVSKAVVVFITGSASGIFGDQLNNYFLQSVSCFSCGCKVYLSQVS